MTCSDARVPQDSEPMSLSLWIGNASDFSSTARPARATTWPQRHFQWTIDRLDRVLRHVMRRRRAQARRSTRQSTTTASPRLRQRSHLRRSGSGFLGRCAVALQSWAVKERGLGRDGAPNRDDRRARSVSFVLELVWPGWSSRPIAVRSPRVTEADCREKRQLAGSCH